MGENKLIAKHVLNVPKEFCNHLRCCKLFRGFHETGILHEDFKNKNLDIFAIYTSISVRFTLVKKL
jgi:hypothetical protein